MEKRKKLIKNNKSFWKWIAYSLFLLLFGTSVIFNITYLPKYFILKKQEGNNQQILNINVSAYDENYKELISFHYQTILATLGQLMAQDSNTYHLKDYGEPLGRMLTGISYYDENNELKTKKEGNGYWWAIYYNGKNPNIGIDNLYLKSNDNISLIFSAINSL